MRYGSVCSGIEAATVAWHPLGWQPAFFSEIEAFPRAVLAHHYPLVPLHGDFTTIKGDEYGAIDLLVGGTPCQSFSVAGLRGGLADDRGNLALEFLRLADRTRARWLVWENVPGVLSSNGGRDFGSILGGMVKLGYGIAYRVLDAQHFGVPQRRRRVFVVGYLGDWRRAAAVLFERHSLQGHPAPRREAREAVTHDIAPSLRARSNASHRLDSDTYVADSLTVGANQTFGFPGEAVAASTGDTAHCLNAGGMGRNDYETETLITHAPAQCFEWQRGATQNLEVCDGFSPALIKSQTPAVAFAIQERAVSENPDNGPQGKGWQADAAFTLEARNETQAVAFDLRGRDGGAMPEGPHDTANIRAASGGSSRSYVAFDTTQITSAANRSNPKSGDPCHPLAAGAHAPAIAIQGAATRQTTTSGPGGVGVRADDTAYTLEARHEVQAVQYASAVRRLTPRECERLQGFPDDYTLIPYRNKPAADGPRYKALGNSMAVLVMRWIGERIADVEALASMKEAAE